MARCTLWRQLKWACACHVQLFQGSQWTGRPPMRSDYKRTRASFCRRCVSAVLAAQAPGGPRSGRANGRAGPNAHAAQHRARALRRRRHVLAHAAPARQQHSQLRVTNQPLVLPVRSGIGVFNIVLWDWTILRAVNPRYWVMFLVSEGTRGWHLLGSIVLCITGSPQSPKVRPWSQHVCISGCSLQ